MNNSNLLCFCYVSTARKVVRFYGYGPGFNLRSLLFVNGTLLRLSREKKDYIRSNKIGSNSMMICILSGLIFCNQY